MAKQKACKKCKIIYTGVKCSRCGSDEGKEGFRGKVSIFNPEESEIAKKLNIKEKGVYAIKI